VLSLIYQPIVFFRARLSRPASWWLALGGPLGCAALAVVSHAIFAEKVSGPVLAAAAGSRSLALSLQYMGVVNAGFVSVVIWLMASAFMMSFSVLFGEDRDVARILEGNALAFYSQLPWLLALIGVAVWFQPPAAWMLGAPLASPGDFDRFRRLLEHEPVLIAIRALNQCFAAWLYVLFGFSYHAATGSSLPGSILLALVTYALFHLLRLLL
jgi:hypothetical protein